MKTVAKSLPQSGIESENAAIVSLFGGRILFPLAPAQIILNRFVYEV